jgi:proline racemase
MQNGLHYFRFDGLRALPSGRAVRPSGRIRRKRSVARFVRIVNTIDSQTAGEPTWLVVGGLPPLRGDTMAEKLFYARRELDHERSRLMLEPCGRQDMYGALLTPPVSPNADFGLVFMNTRQYTTMCGHAVIGAATTVLKTDMIRPVEPETEVLFETPVGMVHTVARVIDGRVRDVSFYKHFAKAPTGTAAARRRGGAEKDGGSLVARSVIENQNWIRFWLVIGTGDRDLRGRGTDGKRR